MKEVLTSPAMLLCNFSYLKIIHSFYHLLQVDLRRVVFPETIVFTNGRYNLKVKFKTLQLSWCKMAKTICNCNFARFHCNENCLKYFFSSVQNCIRLKFISSSKNKYADYNWRYRYCNFTKLYLISNWQK